MSAIPNKWPRVLAVLVLAGCAGTQTSSVTQTSAVAPDRVGSSAPATTGVSLPGKDPTAPTITILPADKDPTRAQIQSMLKEGPPENERSRPIREALEQTLAFSPMEGRVFPGPVGCSRKLCAADVFYASPADFRAFDAATLTKPVSPFNRWRGPNGHSGLLRQADGRLVATWYFMAPDARMPRGVRARLNEKADQMLHEARVRSTSRPGSNSASQRGAK